MVAKSIWGNINWYLFHSMAYKLKDDNNHLIKPMFKLIKLISSNLPCPQCSLESRYILNKININTIKTKEDLIQVLFRFHNMVNKKLKKKAFTMDEHNNLYKKANLKKIIYRWYMIMSKESHGGYAMFNSISHNTMRKNVMTFYSKNKNEFNN